MAVLYRDGRFEEVLSFEDFLKLSQFHQRSFANTGQSFDEQRLRSLLQDAVTQARDWMRQRKTDFETVFEPKLAAQLQELKSLEGKQMQQLEISFADATGTKSEAKEAETRRIRKLFTDYESWIKDTMSVSTYPYLQVLAAVQGMA